MNWLKTFLARIDVPLVLSGLRTAGALLIGNTFVVPVLTDGKSRWWWVLLIAGIVILIWSSLKPKSEKSS